MFYSALLFLEKLPDKIETDFKRRLEVCFRKNMRGFSGNTSDYGDPIKN